MSVEFSLKVKTQENILTREGFFFFHVLHRFLTTYWYLHGYVHRTKYPGVSMYF